jgi:hypothetical protein
VPDSTLRFEILSVASDAIDVWFPAAGDVRDDFKQSIYFQCLKSGRRYNAVRHRVFGSDNWTFAGHYVPDTARLLVAREEALALIHRPAFRAQLDQHRQALTRLGALLQAGRCSITEAMLLAHPHLRTVLAVLYQSSRCLPNGE